MQIADGERLQGMSVFKLGLELQVHRGGLQPCEANRMQEDEGPGCRASSLQSAILYCTSLCESNKAEVLCFVSNLGGGGVKWDLNKASRHSLRK